MVCFNFYYLKPYLLLIMPCMDKHLQPVGGGGGSAGVGGREIEIGLVATLKKYSKGCPLLATRSSHLLGSVKETQHS